MIEQSELQPSSLERALESWIDSPNEQRKAVEALTLWDAPEAAHDILNVILEAAQK